MDESSQKSRLFIPEIKKEIQVLSYGYSDKKVLLAHGWSGRSTQLFMIANRLLKKDTWSFHLIDQHMGSFQA